MESVKFYNIKSSGGLRAEVSNLGAKITKLLVANAKGEVKDVVLGFNTAEEWRTQETYFNAICGRVANRIRLADGTVLLHGGAEGFNAKIWEVTAQSAYEITLHYRSKDGEEGFAGTLDIWVTYTATRDNRLRIHYEAKTDQPTIAAFTNHAYFNLAGEDSGRIDEHILQMPAERYTVFDKELCPTGELASVAGTDLDFRTPRAIGAQKIDNNWCLCAADAPKELRLAATLQADGRTMECWTTMKGMQVYTGDWIEQHTGKSGAQYDKHHAVCLEAQNWPDAINHPDFPSIALRPGERLDEITEYRFKVES